MSTNSWLKVILALWVLGFLVVACGPAIAANGIGGTLIGGVIGGAFGLFLFIPWIIGVGILLLLMRLTEPRGRTQITRRQDTDDRDPVDRYPDDRSPR